MTKKITFIPANDAAKEFPPVPMKKEVPQWYKNVPNLVEGCEETGKYMGLNWKQRESLHTIKKCVPVLDFLSSGYVLKTYTETHISVDNNSENQNMAWFGTGGVTTFSTHPNRQCPIKIEDEAKTYLKIGCGWTVKTPPGYSCLFYQSTYLFEDRFTLFPAIVDTDTYDNEVFFPGFMNKPYKNIKIEAGTNIMAVLPFKRDEWESEIREDLTKSISKEFNKRQAQKMFDVYKTFFHQKKSYK